MFTRPLLVVAWEKTERSSCPDDAFFVTLHGNHISAVTRSTHICIDPDDETFSVLVAEDRHDDASFSRELRNLAEALPLTEDELLSLTVGMNLPRASGALSDCPGLVHIYADWPDAAGPHGTGGLYLDGDLSLSVGDSGARWSVGADALPSVRAWATRLHKAARSCLSG